jgi:hypothetical protein
VALVDGTTIDGRSPVEDRELLYRNIKRGYWRERGGDFELSTQAFTDPSYRISVYRAELCGNDPSHAKEEEEDYVRSIRTETVRGIDTVIRYRNNDPVQHHRVNVAPDPKPDDCSHAVICTDPEITSQSVFRRLQVRLVCLSDWEPNYGP